MRAAAINELESVLCELLARSYPEIPQRERNRIANQCAMRAIGEAIAEVAKLEQHATEPEEG